MANLFFFFFLKMKIKIGEATFKASIKVEHSNILVAKRMKVPLKFFTLETKSIHVKNRVCRLQWILMSSRKSLETVECVRDH